MVARSVAWLAMSGLSGPIPLWMRDSTSAWPKVAKEAPMSDARINTHVVMPQGNSKMSQYSRKDEYSDDDNNNVGLQRNN